MMPFSWQEGPQLAPTLVVSFDLLEPSQGHQALLEQSLIGHEEDQLWPGVIYFQHVSVASPNAYFKG